MVVAILRPNWVNSLAHKVGVGRGTDLVLYALAVAFVFVSVNTYFRLKTQEARFTELARAIAVRDATELNAQRLGRRPRVGGAPMSTATGLTAGDKVLITGGAGFIGSTVASACLDAGLVPVILDNLSTGRREFTEGRYFYEGDIADPDLLDRSSPTTRTSPRPCTAPR